MIVCSASKQALRALPHLFGALALLALGACTSAGDRLATGSSASASPTTGEVVPVFVATTRKMGPDGSVSAELSSKTNYLMNLISIPKDHKTGTIERPSWGNESRKSHFVFIGQRVLDHDAFRNEIATQLSGRIGTSRDVLVYVHGFNTGYDEARFRLAQIATDSGFTGVSI